MKIPDKKNLIELLTTSSTSAFPFVGVFHGSAIYCLEFKKII